MMREAACQVKTNNMLGPNTLKSEVQVAVQRMKNGESVGTDEIAVE